MERRSFFKALLAGAATIATGAETFKFRRINKIAEPQEPIIETPTLDYEHQAYGFSIRVDPVFEEDRLLATRMQDLLNAQKERMEREAEHRACSAFYGDHPSRMTSWPPKIERPSLGAILDTSVS